MKAVIVILLLCTLGLAGGLMWRHTKATKQLREDWQVKFDLTNQIVDVKKELEVQEQKFVDLKTTLDQRDQELTATSNNLIKVMADLGRAQRESSAATEAAKVELARRDARIAELEGDKEKMDKKAAELQGAIGGLEKSIAETEKKLAAAEGDRDFLVKELKRLQSEKAELERQFHDLSLLRAQVAKIKDDLSISRRLEWLRSGLYGLSTERGAQKLMQAATQMPDSKFPLNVEIKQGGGSKVVSGAITNVPAPAPKPVPAK